MTTSFEKPIGDPMPLDQILESVVIANWKDLIRGTNPGLVHVEYHVGNASQVENLRIWSSTARGYWNLVCHCSLGPDLSTTLQFKDGYGASNLGALLQSILKHQGDFSLKCPADSDHMVQVGSPSGEVIAAAKSSLDKVIGN